MNMLETEPTHRRLVDVGGYQLRVTEAGHGRPPVVLLAGGMDPVEIWADVLPEIAAFTQVCAVDRAGVGESEAGPEPATVGRIADDLHTLLSRTGMVGPVVLVAHSIGGAAAR